MPDHRLEQTGALVYHNVNRLTGRTSTIQCNCYLQKSKEESPYSGDNDQMERRKKTPTDPTKCEGVRDTDGHDSTDVD